MAELIAGLDGPVVRGAGGVVRQPPPAHAKRAIKKVLELQVRGTGFAFLEVLSECPVHLGLAPEMAENWVRDNMVPVFPLGVKKDISTGAAYPTIPTATFGPLETLSAIGRDKPTGAPFRPRVPCRHRP